MFSLSARFFLIPLLTSCVVQQKSVCTLSDRRSMIDTPAELANARNSSRSLQCSRARPRVALRLSPS